MQPLGYVAIAFLVLLAGGAVTLASGLVQLRGLVQGVRARGVEARLRTSVLASSVGLGSIGGTALALVAGGPGALLWMWVATLLGMGLTWAEVTLAVRFRGSRPDGTPEAGPIYYMRGGLRRLGKPLALLFAFAMPLTALAMGGLFQAQQTAQLWFSVTDASPAAVGVALAVVALALMLIKDRRARRGLLLLVPVALISYAILLTVVVVSDPQALGEALSRVFAGAMEGGALLGGAAGGSLLIAIQHGFLRASFANESGLGTAALAPEVLEAPDASRAGRAAMLAPLINGGLIAGLTGLGILVSGAQPRQEVAERDAKSGLVVMAALERPHARGLIPSLERGQVVVLPDDTPLQSLHRYPFVMRANPRGSQVGNFSADENAIAIPVWEISENVDTIVFRSADPKRRENPAYDRRIAVTQERRVLANGVESIVLHPVDEGLSLGDLRREMRGPYVQLEDFYFTGGVAAATHPRYGDHLAMFDDPPKGVAANPGLRTVISFGFRGPYFYSEGESGRPPTGMIGAEGLEAPIGTLLTLRMHAPPRGVDLGHLVKGTGEYRTPGWNFLERTTHAVLRHTDDPAQDLLIPVDHHTGDDGTLRFTSAAPEIADFARAEHMVAYTGPYLLPPPFEFQVEAHSSLPLADEWRDRVSLVPLHDHPEARGGSGELYDPHPGEVFLTDMQGPFLVREGSVLVADAVERGAGRTGTFVLAGIAFVLASMTAVGWAAGAARVLAYLLGPSAGLALKLAMLVSLIVGATATLDTVLALAEPLMLATLAINVVAVLLLLPRALSPK